MIVKGLGLSILMLGHADIRQPLSRLFLECIIFVGKILIRVEETPVVLFSLGPPAPFHEKFGIIPQTFIPFGSVRPDLLLPHSE